MYPAASISQPPFQQQLVEVQMAGDIVEVALRLHDRRAVYVGGLATQVLRVRHASHGLVKPLTAVAAADEDAPELQAQRFQYVLTERTQRLYLNLAGYVVDA
jgi:hypothetical protein